MLAFYLVADVSPIGGSMKPLAIAGQNVLLAYLLSGLLPAALGLIQLDDW